MKTTHSPTAQPHSGPRRALVPLVASAVALVACACSGSFSAPADGGPTDATSSADASMDGYIIILQPDGGGDASDDVLDAGDASLASEAGDGGDGGCAAPLSLDCTGTCVDPTLPSHCGSCTNVCAGPDSGTGAATCSAGACGVGCSGATPVNCGGACVDPATPAHCGSCANACPGPTAGTGSATCTIDADGGGTCSVTCDGATSLVCGDTCFDPADPAHCGSCTHVCPAPPSGKGQATCASPPTCGVTCSTGYHLCGGDCLSDEDLPSDTADPCIVSSQGVFVATTGMDAPAGGTPTAPFATISYALQHLGPTARVYVCNGAYSDKLTIMSAVGIYGGLSCTGGTWAYAGAGGKATVTSSSASGGPALTVTGVTGLVQIEDMGFVSQTATGMDNAGNGLSSIAALVSASSDVSFVRCTLSAGNGAAADKVIPLSGNNNVGSGPSAQPNNVGVGGTGGSNICGYYGTSAGGAGASATGSNNGSNGSASPPSTLPVFPDDGLGGAFNQPGDPGAAGESGAGGNAAMSYGTLSATGWTPAHGGDGATGFPGQGGGGGGTTAGHPEPGGCGGGAGGCGGAFGPGGASGGASIALASVASTVAIDSGSTLSTGTGGAAQGGGLGSNGQAGLQGASAPPAISGGVGGPGGGGGGGAAGSGGISVCIAYTSTVPTSSATCSPGAGGQPGAGGTGGANGAGVSSPLANGATGLAGATMSPLLVQP